MPHRIQKTLIKDRSNPQLVSLRLVFLDTLIQIQPLQQELLDSSVI